MVALHATLRPTPRLPPPVQWSRAPTVAAAAPAAKGRGAEPPDVVRDCKRLDELMKSGQLGDALDLFDRMPRKNVVAWTSVISGCTRNGRPKAALVMFAAMLESGVAPDDSACNATCAAACALRLGEQVHSLAVRVGFAEDAWIGACLVELYT
ncbi:hypothetical protein BAE44_0004040, partial [Dichanthelium oligosanthes]